MKCIHCKKTMKHHIGAELLCPGQGILDRPRRRYELSDTDHTLLVIFYDQAMKEKRDQDRVARSIKKQLDINQPKKRKR